MKINKRTIRYVLKHTDSTIDDLIKWFKGWKVEYHGEQPCIMGHLYHGIYTFCRLDCDLDNHIFIDGDVVFDLDVWFFPRKFVNDKQFRAEFLAELEKLRGEFE